MFDQLKTAFEVNWRPVANLKLAVTISHSDMVARDVHRNPRQSWPDPGGRRRQHKRERVGQSGVILTKQTQLVMCENGQSQRVLTENVITLTGHRARTKVTRAERTGYHSLVRI